MTTTLRHHRIHLFVPGSPAPQGSKRLVGHNRLIESSKAVGPWRDRIAFAALKFKNDSTLLLPVDNQAVWMVLKFVMPRPSSTPKTRATPPAIRRPDLDKLSRSVFDALTGIIYTDDAQITHLEAHKRIAEPNETPGVHIAIETLP